MSNKPCGLSPPSLTFSHRSGVTPYTSSYEFAGSCVFGKQSLEILSLRPTLCKHKTGKAYPKVTPSFFAEFLNEDSPVPLRLLASPTSGGLRYGFHSTNLRGFSRRCARSTCHGKIPRLASTLKLAIKRRYPDFPGYRSRSRMPNH